jgi:aspartate racemase
MKKIGIVGGIAWLSTVDYYSGICRRSEQRHLALKRPGVPATPEMSIESLDLNKVFSYIGTDGDEASWAQFDDYHRTALQRLEASGAEFAALASNTPHHRLASIARGIGIPIVSIFEAAAKEGARIGAREVLILGTGVTMGSAVFRTEFAKYGITAAGPHDETARGATRALIAELQLGKAAGAADRLRKIAKNPTPQFQAQPAACLACTELPLAFPEQKMLASFEYGGVSYINTVAAHIDAICDFALDD